ncbi:MAG: hypothetical protein GFH27_549415n7 [Chloroflexi bacterium AL-W]|nr:hypothetical protein [Chloroflexi bacterium AL-W]
MNVPKEMNGHFRRTFGPILGVGLLFVFGFALLFAIGWINTHGQNTAQLVRYLLISGSVSIGLVVAALFWLQRGLGRLWIQATLTYTIGVGVAVLNVFTTAGLMFSSDQDYWILTLLLLFAAVMSVGLGYILTYTIVRRVTALHEGAQALASGKLDTHVTAIGRDELADLANEFNRMAQQLARSSAERTRLEAARRDLIASVSHDLRTPLTSLRGMTEAIADGLVQDRAMMQRYLTTMRSQIDHLSDLIDDLFELSQIDAGVLKLELQRITPGDLVSDTIEAMRPQANAHGVVLLGSVDPDIKALLVAPQKVERVFYNLVTNAIRHTPSDGAVTIAIRHAEQGCDIPDTQPEHQSSEQSMYERALQAPHCVIVEISDTGEGINPEDLPHIFDRFYRGEKSRSRATGGTGLGLAIAKGIVEAHGGCIWIESTLQQGTCVRFTLPYTT